MQNNLISNAKGLLQKGNIMIEIDKNDFLYKHLTKLGAENIDDLYVEFAQNGVANATDFKKYLYRLYGDDFSKEIDDESIKELLPYYVDMKKIKKISNAELKKILKEYKQNPDDKKLSTIVHSKLKDCLFIASLYKLKLPNTDISDIVQTCNLGLLKAVEKYDVDAKISFDEYVEFWVAMEIKTTYFKENYNG